ncbi:hypothetical protein [Serratia fonticola]|uniref:hypothetical protein n=1 Tax=Serratia fonticola TaxID=47917 RepID=UPI00192C420B|nr:hypothetical protein [Serratia fonticola]MBL5906142.1 hypothetical protein [Serratia fonticola]
MLLRSIWKFIGKQNQDDIKVDNIYFSETAGSYNKFYFRLIVRKLYDSQLDPNTKLTNFSNDEMAVLFHEYIHHLQNISSVSGLWHCDALVSIWHNTRNYIQDNNDKDSYSRALEAHDRVQFFFRTENQYKGKKSINLNALKSIQLNIESSSKDSMKKITEDLIPPIKLEGFVDENRYEIKFGMYEFLESAAYELEKYYRLQIGMRNPDSDTISIPYKLAQSLRHVHAPFLSDEQLIKVILTAMQHIAPHSAFIFILQELKKIKTKNIDIILEHNIKSLIVQQEEWIDSIITQIHNGFPIDDPVHGNFIKSLFDSIKENIITQKTTPYPELNFITGVDKDNHKEKLMQLIDKSGGCIIGIKDGLDKNDSFIIGGDESTFINNRGWQVLQASTHYAMLHYKENAIHTQPQDNCECPMISFCRIKNEINDFIKCQQTPWLHPEATGDGKDCPYQLAVFKFQLKNSQI